MTGFVFSSQTGQAQDPLIRRRKGQSVDQDLLVVAYSHDISMSDGAMEAARLSLLSIPPAGWAREVGKLSIRLRIHQGQTDSD